MQWPPSCSVIEKELVPYSARHGIGKIFPCLPNNSASHYEKLMTLKSWPNNTIPKGRFRNAFLDKNIFAWFLRAQLRNNRLWLASHSSTAVSLTAGHVFLNAISNFLKAWYFKIIQTCWREQRPPGKCWKAEQLMWQRSSNVPALGSSGENNWAFCGTQHASVNIDEIRERLSELTGKQIDLSTIVLFLLYQLWKAHNHWLKVFLSIACGFSRSRNNDPETMYLIRGPRSILITEKPSDRNPFRNIFTRLVRIKMLRTCAG